MVGTSSDGGINMILALLESVLGGLRVLNDWLQSASLGVGVPCLEESLKASESLCSNRSVAGCFCKSKSLILVFQVGFHELLEQPIDRSCCRSLFGAYGLLWLAVVNRAWWDVSSRAQALYHLCGAESVIV